MSVMPGLTRHPVLSMVASERTEGEKEIVVSLVRQLSWTHFRASETLADTWSRGRRKEDQGPQRRRRR